MTDQASGKRLFVGVRVSVGCANALVACAETLARRAKDARIDLAWVAPTNYHVTLKFLGWTREDAIGAVRDALAQATAGVAPFRFRAARLGAFPSLDRASVLWAGVEEPDATGALAERIERAMTALGFTAETRAFHPHVTLARVRDPRPLRDLVLPMAEQIFNETRVEAVTLFESETRPSGVVYREVARCALGPAPDAMPRAPAPDAGDDTDDGWPRGRTE